MHWRSSLESAIARCRWRVFNSLGERESNSDFTASKGMTTVSRVGYTGAMAWLAKSQLILSVLSYRKLKLQALGSLVNFTQATNACRIADFARAQTVSNQPGHLVRNARATSSLDFVAKMVLVEAKAITQRNRIVLNFNSHPHAQIINDKMFGTFIFEIDD